MKNSGYTQWSIAVLIMAVALPVATVAAAPLAFIEIGKWYRVYFGGLGEEVVQIRKSAESGWYVVTSSLGETYYSNLDTAQRITPAGADFGGPSSNQGLDRHSADDIASRNACINNLRQMSGAKDQYALENDGSAPKTISQLVPDLISRTPTCPLGGRYELRPLGEDPVCSIDGHTI